MLGDCECHVKLAASTAANVRALYAIAALRQVYCAELANGFGAFSEGLKHHATPGHPRSALCSSASVNCDGIWLASISLFHAGHSSD